MADMTRLDGHTTGRRPTRVMSTGWDGNLGINQTGGKNVRSSNGPSFGEDMDGENETCFDSDADDREMGVPPWMRDSGDL